MNRLNQLLKRMILSLCLPLFSVFAYASYAQEATFIDNVLTLSKATVGETAYALELGLSVNQGNYDFGVLAAA